MNIDSETEVLISYVFVTVSQTKMAMTSTLVRVLVFALLFDVCLARSWTCEDFDDLISKAGDNAIQVCVETSKSPVTKK